MTRHFITMMTSSYGNIFRVIGHLCGEFTGHRWIPPQRPVTRSFDVFFDLDQIKRLSKQSRGWWFETPSCPFWRHCDNYHEKFMMRRHAWVDIQNYSFWTLLILDNHRFQMRLPTEIKRNFTCPCRSAFLSKTQNYKSCILHQHHPLRCRRSYFKQGHQ